MSHQQTWDTPGERGVGTHEYECDASGCDETIEAEGTFSEAWAEAKSYGWVCFKDENGDWVHYCPDHKTRDSR